MIMKQLIYSIIALAVSTCPSLANNLPDQLVGHGGPIKAISVASDGNFALTASFDYSIIFWQLVGTQGEIVHQMIGHDAAVNDVVFTPDQMQAVSVSDDGSLGIWNLQTGALEHRIIGPSDKVLDVDLSPDGRFAADARWDATIRIYDLNQGVEIAKLSGHKGNVNTVKFSSDGRKLYSGAYDGQILEWDLETYAMIRPIYRHGWGINSISIVNEDQLLFGALDGTAGLVSIKSARLIQKIAKSERPILSVKVSPDQAQFGYSDGFGQIAIFDSETLDPVEIGQVTQGPVWDFDFVSNVPQVYHVGLDDFVARWQIKPRNLVDIQGKFPRRFQLASAEDPGELEFLRKCSVCHTLTPDSANRAGPTLYGVFGRQAGTLTDYKYSDALYNSNVIWNEHTIGQLFDDGPDIMMPGTKMPIQRLKNIERRDELIQYLKTATTPKGVQ